MRLFGLTLVLLHSVDCGLKEDLRTRDGVHFQIQKDTRATSVKTIPCSGPCNLLSCVAACKEEVGCLTLAVTHGWMQTQECSFELIIGSTPTPKYDTYIPGPTSTTNKRSIQSQGPAIPSVNWGERMVQAPAEENVRNYCGKDEPYAVDNGAKCCALSVNSRDEACPNPSHESGCPATPCFTDPKYTSWRTSPWTDQKRSLAYHSIVMKESPMNDAWSARLKLILFSQYNQDDIAPIKLYANWWTNISFRLLLSTNWLLWISFEVFFAIALYVIQWSEIGPLVQISILLTMLSIGEWKSVCGGWGREPLEIPKDLTWILHN